MRKPQPINVILYGPRTEQGKEELANRVASVHADAVLRRIRDLQCPQEQKDELLDAIIAAVMQRSKEQEQDIER